MSEQVSSAPEVFADEEAVIILRRLQQLEWRPATAWEQSSGWDTQVIADIPATASNGVSRLISDRRYLGLEDVTDPNQIPFLSYFWPGRGYFSVPLLAIEKKDALGGISRPDRYCLYPQFDSRYAYTRGGGLRLSKVWGPTYTVASDVNREQTAEFRELLERVLPALGSGSN